MIFLVSEREGPCGRTRRGQQVSAPTPGLWKTCAYKPTTLKRRTQQVQVLITDYEYKDYILSLLCAPLDWIQ